MRDCEGMDLGLVGEIKVPECLLKFLDLGCSSMWCRHSHRMPQRFVWQL